MPTVAVDRSITCQACTYGCSLVLFSAAIPLFTCLWNALHIMKLCLTCRIQPDTSWLLYFRSKRASARAFHSSAFYRSNIVLYKTTSVVYTREPIRPAREYSNGKVNRNEMPSAAVPGKRTWNKKLNPTVRLMLTSLRHYCVHGLGGTKGDRRTCTPLQVRRGNIVIDVFSKSKWSRSHSAFGNIFLRAQSYNNNNNMSIYRQARASPSVRSAHRPHTRLPAAAAAAAEEVRFQQRARWSCNDCFFFLCAFIR